MTRLTLTRHPDTPCEAVERIEVEVSEPGAGQVRLRYRVIGKIGDILLPAAADPGRADDLWKHTCFEAFVRAPGSESYAEFNFSPSMQWAAYQFDGYRAGMRNAEGPAPSIEVQRGPAHYQLDVTFILPGKGPRGMALTAVIEEADAVKSYWALKHAPGKPDFHHADSFAYELAPTERT